jgi:hypothetical protein
MATPAQTLPPSSENAGTAYLSLIEQQLESEERRRQSLDQRSAALVTISAFLASVLFALAAWALTAASFEPSAITTTIAIGAVILLVAAAGFGMTTMWTRYYAEVKGEELERLLAEKYWQARADIGTQRAAEVLIKVLKDAREKNKQKAGRLQAGLIFEAIAAGLVGVSALLVLAQV